MKTRIYATPAVKGLIGGKTHANNTYNITFGDFGANYKMF